MKNPVSRVVQGLTLAAASAAVFLSGYWLHDDKVRAVIDIAGDDGLPGSTPLPDWQATRHFSERLAQDAPAYLELLGREDLFALALVAVFLSIAWVTWRSGARAWLLVAAAVLYCASEWSENRLLAHAVEARELGAAPYVAAAGATVSKWILVCASAALAAMQLAIHFGPRLPWRYAVFHDVPGFVDRAWRRMEMRANAEFTDLPPTPHGLQPRPFWRLPAFWLFAATALFICFGPTLSGFCSASPLAARTGLALLGTALAVGLCLTLVKAGRWIFERFPEYWAEEARVHEMPDEAQMHRRRRITGVVLALCALVLAAPVGLGALAALTTAFADICGAYSFSALSLWRLVLWVGAVAAFAIVWSLEPRTSRLIAWQAAILGATALVYWFWLSSEQASEASGAPYRHAFAVAAPLVALLLVIAPRRAFSQLGRPLAEYRERFRKDLEERPLLKPRQTPPLPTGPAVLHALFYGVAYRWLEFLLIPALLALVAPPDWLLSMTALGLLLSIGLSTWGNLCSYWRQMTLLVQRWFLSGVPYFVSLFVIALGVCRVGGVSYVTTLLDGAPFGVIFTGTVMCYVLSWLVEYWINRAAGTELLRVLGHAGGQSALVYDYKGPGRAGVEHVDHCLIVHGLGRFLVRARVPGERSPAFHAYGMGELFAELAGADKPRAAVVERQLHLYFYLLNVFLALLAAGFAAVYWYYYNVAKPAAVVVAHAEGDERRLNDLAERLLAAPGDERPALVVAASGGGTRAAVFAAHVLEGLHNIGLDRDIVLTSGVSGGGVALAYFALHYPELSEASPAAIPRWAQFKRLIEANYIDAVLEGATEWRIFRTSPLTVLLAENFERHLFAGAKRAATFDLPQAPALILNTTVSGHPDDESALLTVTLDQPAAAGDCNEDTRPYKLMNGGRLIFTNIRHTSAFPKRGSPIPDVRLPYTIVRNPDVGLAAAAALNANFPPVFPNARVELKALDPHAACPDRSYLVTDGGAQENLGLVSALFALQSALNEIAARCGGKSAQGDPWCARRLRPIHVVISEASATGYDYEQDRGLSAGLEGAKDRMTGELTNRLIADTEALVKACPLAAGAGRMRFHFLAMPLVFRARGGVGTHWTHADHFTLSDPRLRAPFAALAGAKVGMHWRDITRMWTAMHDPGGKFCTNLDYSDGGVNTDTVRRWICGWRFAGNQPRDLHVLEWRSLLAELMPAPSPKLP